MVRYSRFSVTADFVFMRQMDPELLDTGRYKMYNLSLDSRFADVYYNQTADWLIRLPTVYKNIMRIALSSIEIPNVEWVFSARHGNLNIAYCISGADTVYAEIPGGNYTVEGLISAVGTALGSGFTVSISLTTGECTITNKGSLPVTLSMASTDPSIAERSRYWGLGFWLGFRDKTVIIPASGSVTGNAVVLVQATPYYIIQLLLPERVDNIIHMVGSGDSVVAFAKVVLRNEVYSLEFDDNANLLRKQFTFLSPVNISQMRLRILDPYGSVVDMRDMDWSCTMEFYEIVNSRTYNRLTETFGLRTRPSA